LTVMGPEARVLARKEIRQLLRSRGALVSALMLPVIFLIVVPGIQYAAFSSTPSRGRAPEAIPAQAPAGIAGLKPVGLVVYYLMPMFVSLAGLLMPSVLSLYTVVQERERKTLELLVALPVRLTDILFAKLAATLLVAVVVMMPLYAVQATGLLVTGLAGPGWVLEQLFLLVCAIASSISVAFVLAVLARDFRTSQQINGLLLLPNMLLVNAVLLLVPVPVKLLVLGGLLVLVGAAVLAVAIRWLTLERYLS